MSRVHVFGIIPNSKGEEEGYAFPIWEPEPENPEDIEVWRDRNPIWGLCEDLGIYLDESFVENFSQGDRDVWEYLSYYITKVEDIQNLRIKLGHCVEFVLVFERALDEFLECNPLPKFFNTDGAIYAGEFDCVLNV